MPTLAQDLMNQCEDDVYPLGMRVKKLVQVLLGWALHQLWLDTCAMVRKLFVVAPL